MSASGREVADALGPPYSGDVVGAALLRLAYQGRAPDVHTLGDLDALDLDDHETVARVHALLRRATLGGGAVAHEDSRGWHVCVWTPYPCRAVVDGATKAEALVSALVWLSCHP